jgi:hypothetical protein
MDRLVRPFRLLHFDLLRLLHLGALRALGLLHFRLLHFRLLHFDFPLNLGLAIVDVDGVAGMRAHAEGRAQSNRQCRCEKIGLKHRNLQYVTEMGKPAAPPMPNNTCDVCTIPEISAKNDYLIFATAACPRRGDARIIRIKVGPRRISERNAQRHPASKARAAAIACSSHSWRAQTLRSTRPDRPSSTTRYVFIGHPPPR